MLILGLETSCDETSVALVEAKRGILTVRQNLVYSQINLHKKYGGVVPEVAARRHVEKIVPLIKKIFEDNLARDDKIQKPDLIAVTAGPGLATALLVGVETARTLSYLWNKPLVAVNHLEGHIYANWLLPCGPRENRKQKIGLDSRSQISVGDGLRRIGKKIFPILCLIVSGGHTELILMKDHLKYKLIGQTRDDAAGECFDKVGKILGLPYPGGPEVAKLAAKGNPQAIKFPRPMINDGDFSAKGGPASGWDFSFSGLKTAVLYYCHSEAKPENSLKQRRGFLNFVCSSYYAHNDKKASDICASFQQACLDVLIAKTLATAKKYQVKTLLLGGGVAANQELQKQLIQRIKGQIPKIVYQPPAIQYCGDNAAMIAAAGYFHALKKNFTTWPKIKIDPNWDLV